MSWNVSWVQSVTKECTSENQDDPGDFLEDSSFLSKLFCKGWGWDLILIFFSSLSVLTFIILIFLVYICQFICSFFLQQKTREVQSVTMDNFMATDYFKEQMPHECSIFVFSTIRNMSLSSCLQLVISVAFQDRMGPNSRFPAFCYIVIKTS